MKDCGREHPAIEKAPYIYPELWTMWYCECFKCQEALKERDGDGKPTKNDVLKSANR